MYCTQKRFRLLVLLILGFLLAGLFPAAALAQSEVITIIIDGEELKLQDPAVLQDGYVVAPVRAVAEALQARVTWNEATNEVIITGPQTTIKLIVGSREVFRDGKRVFLAVPVELHNDRVLAPVRFLAEALGARVFWNGLTRTVAITTPPPAVPERVYAASFTGKLVMSNLEGRHFELETGQGRLVLVPAEGEPSVAQALEKYAGQVVIVEGVITNEPNIYMRAPLMRVKSILPTGENGKTAPGKLTEFTIARPYLVVKGQSLSRVEIWAIPTGTGITEKDYILLGQASKQSETAGQQVWTFPIPRETILATEIFARGYDEQGREAGRISLPIIGVTDLNKALGTGE